MKQRLTAIQKRWLDALESGKYVRTTDVLYAGKNRYCCLGVAEKVCFNREFVPKEGSRAKFALNDDSEESIVMLDSDFKELGLYDNDGSIKEKGEISFFQCLQDRGYKGPEEDCLAAYNDNGATFKQIAGAIRACPEAVFKSR